MKQFVLLGAIALFGWSCGTSVPEGVDMVTENMGFSTSSNEKEGTLDSTLVWGSTQFNTQFNGENYAILLGSGEVLRSTKLDSSETHFNGVDYSSEGRSIRFYKRNNLFVQDCIRLDNNTKKGLFLRFVSTDSSLVAATVANDYLGGLIFAK